MLSINIKKDWNTTRKWRRTETKLDRFLGRINYIFFLKTIELAMGKYPSTKDWIPYPIFHFSLLLRKCCRINGIELMIQRNRASIEDRKVSELIDPIKWKTGPFFMHPKSFITAGLRTKRAPVSSSCCGCSGEESSEFRLGKPNIASTRLKSCEQSTHLVLLPQKQPRRNKIAEVWWTIWYTNAHLNIFMVPSIFLSNHQ